MSGLRDRANCATVDRITDRAVDRLRSVHRAGRCSVNCILSLPFMPCCRNLFCNYVATSCTGFLAASCCGTGRLLCYGPAAIGMSLGRYCFLLNGDSAAISALFSFCKAGRRAGRINCRNLLKDMIDSELCFCRRPVFCLCCDRCAAAFACFHDTIRSNSCNSAVGRVPADII